MQYSKTNGQTKDVMTETLFDIGVDTAELPTKIIDIYKRLHTIGYHGYDESAYSLIISMMYEWNSSGGISDSTYRSAKVLEAAWESELEALKTQELT